MTRRTILVHGWGFDRTFWNAVAPRLDETPVLIDLGFFGASRTMISSDAPVFAVGHSLGLMWLLLNGGLPPGSRVAAIGGFTRFARADDFPDGVPERILARMQSALTRDASSVVAQFRDRCGLPAGAEVPAGMPDVPALSAGLSLLRNGDARSCRNQVVRVLAARDDAIVSPAMTAACFTPEQIETAETGGHLLPLARPELSARFIRETKERAWS